MSALTFAALQLVLVGMAHAYLGERYILALFRGTEFTSGILRFAWHATSIGWWGSAALFLLARGGPPRQAVCRVTGVTCLLIRVSVLGGFRGRTLASIVLLAVAVTRIRAATGGI